MIAFLARTQRRGRLSIKRNTLLGVITDKSDGVFNRETGEFLGLIATTPARLIGLELTGIVCLENRLRDGLLEAASARLLRTATTAQDPRAAGSAH